VARTPPSAAAVRALEGCTTWAAALPASTAPVVLAVQDRLGRLRRDGPPCRAAVTGRRLHSQGSCGAFGDRIARRPWRAPWFAACCKHAHWLRPKLAFNAAARPPNAARLRALLHQWVVESCPSSALATRRPAAAARQADREVHRRRSPVGRQHDTLRSADPAGHGRGAGGLRTSSPHQGHPAVSAQLAAPGVTAAGRGAAARRTPAQRMGLDACRRCHDPRPPACLPAHAGRSSQTPSWLLRTPTGASTMLSPLAA